MDIEIKIPDIGIDQAEVIDILVQVNDVIKQDQSLIVIEGDKASMEVPSPYNGIIKEIKVKVTDIVQKDFVIMIIEIIEDNTINQKNIQKNTNLHHSLVHASPLIRRLARSLDIDLSQIIGSGRNNRIIKKDLDNHITDLRKNHDTEISSEGSSKNINNLDFHQFGEVQEVKLNKIKKISGKLLFHNWKNIPHVTQFDEVDITDLEIFRIKYNKEHISLLTKEKKLTLLSFIIKAIAIGLEKFPYFNSTIAFNGEVLFLKKYINIGIAVDTDDGLFVPVIKNVKEKKLSDIAYEVYQKSNDARSGKLRISDLQGGSFTVSSLGSIGGTTFTPIINSSEAAILGVSKFSYKPIWNGSEFVPKLILPLSLSYDHRIIDGAEGVRFINFINKLLSDIRLLLV